MAFFESAAFIGGAIAACIIIPSEVAAAKERRRERARAAVVPVPETEPATGPVYNSTKYAVPTPAREGVHGILFSAFRSLNKQNAAGYGSWLSCCLERLQNGLPVPTAVALRALNMTKKELAGARYSKENETPVYFDLSGLDAAIAALEIVTGD